MGKCNQEKPFKKIYSQQRHAIRVVYSKDRSSHTRELFKECEVLNIYQVNIWKNLVLMQQTNSDTLPTIFLNKYKRSTHNYPTNFARTSYSIPPFKLNLNTEFHSEAQHCGKIFQLIQKKATKGQYL